jgi:hypothetical protein
MATKKTSSIEILALDAVIDRKQAVAAKFRGYINGLAFDGVAYFENQLYNTIDLFSIVDIKKGDQRNIKVLVKRICYQMEAYEQYRMNRIQESALVYHSRLYNELDQKHNGQIIALQVPECEQNEVMQLGGIWHPITKGWVVTSKNPNLAKFEKWRVGLVH